MRPVLLALFLPCTALAFEGHWRPSQVPDLADELKELGMTMPASRVADLGGAPLGAIVDMEVCSGAFISPDGLIATAYHCVTDGLQFASVNGEDLFEDGFHARTRGDERWAGPDQGVRVTTEVRDVTEVVLAGTNKLDQAERLERIEHNSKKLVAKCESGPDVHCEVATYNEGAEYELITQLELRDVRLVYAPPRPVGYFGGDDDNWRWPRHSGDFAFLRAYVSPQGRSMPNHPGNVPYQPPTHLKVAPQGVTAGDFVMVAGYPSLSYRWRTAAELDFYEKEGYPMRIEVRRAMVDILEKWMERVPELAGKLGPRRLNFSNDLVYYEGTLAELQRSGASEARWQLESDMGRWIAADPGRSEKWGAVLDTVHRVQADQNDTARRDYVMRQMTTQVDMLRAALDIWRLAEESQRADKDRASGYQNRDRPAIDAELAQMDARHDWRVDADMLRWFLITAMTLPEGTRVPELANWLDWDPKKQTLEAAVDARVRELYVNTDLHDPDHRRDLMGTSTWYLERGENPWFGLAKALDPYLDRAEADAERHRAQWRVLKPFYTTALQEFIPEGRPRYGGGKVKPGLYYPDANRTLRFAAGRVDGYSPTDGLIAAPFTSLYGISEKAGLPPYDVSTELVSAIDAAEYGPYEKKGFSSVPVNFASTVDTARGSSGSATLNANGEFVGIIFDGNFESIASDWIFDDLTRSIHTDVRFMLWYLDRMAGAGELLRELGVDPAFEGSADAEGTD